MIDAPLAACLGRLRRLVGARNLPHPVEDRRRLLLGPVRPHHHAILPFLLIDQKCPPDPIRSAACYAAHEYAVVLIEKGHRGRHGGRGPLAMFASQVKRTSWRHELVRSAPQGSGQSDRDWDGPGAATRRVRSRLGVGAGRPRSPALGNTPRAGHGDALGATDRERQLGVSILAAFVFTPLRSILLMKTIFETDPRLRA